MKRLRHSALAALTVVALMALAGSATATTLTSPAGTTYTGTVKAQSQGNHFAIDRPNGETVACGKSNLEWKAESHGAGLPVKGPVASFTVGECSGNTTIAFLNPGVFELHTSSWPPAASDPITWDDFEFTLITHTILGSIHCTYGYTLPLQAGAITSSWNTGQTARLKLSALVPIRAGGGTCGKTVQVTADYTISSPDYLDVD